MEISAGDVEYVAKLAKLNIPKEQKDEFRQKMSSILKYMEQLQEVDTTDILPTTHVLPLENVLREDNIGPSLAHERALANAPDSQDGYFKVPKIL